MILRSALPFFFDFDAKWTPGLVASALRHNTDPCGAGVVRVLVKYLVWELAAQIKHQVLPLVIYVFVTETRDLQHEAGLGMPTR